MSQPAEEISGALIEVLSSRSVGERNRMVRQVADLFLTQQANYSTDQIQLFDSVIMKMIGEVDEAVRIYMSERFAAVDNAPRSVVRMLANDTDPAVAGPVLTQSRILDEDFLVENAKTHSQEHLIAISQRMAVGPRVTDVLVHRGNDRVVMTLAQNNGAELSERGYSVIVDRAKDNRQLARVVWNRPDISRPHLVALFEKASEAVRHQLEAEGGRKAEEIVAAVKLAQQHLQEASQAESDAYAEARAHIAALKQTGGLSETHVLTFARQGRFEEVVIAVSELGELPAIDTERMILEQTCDRLFVVARAIGLSWTCVRQIVLLNQTVPRATDHLEQLRAKYQTIPREVAAKGLRFHQLREKARNSTKP